MRKKLLIIPIIALLAAVGAGIHFITLPAFDATPNSVTVLTMHSPNPVNFLAFCQSGSDITVELVSPPAALWQQSGQFAVALELSQGRRRVQKNAYVYVLAPLSYKQVEVGAPMDTIDPRAFLNGARTVPPGALFDVSFVTVLEGLTDETGEYPVTLRLNGDVFSSMLHVVDTTAPTAAAVDMTVDMGAAVLPEYFVTDIFDHSLPVAVSFNGDKPDTLVPGQQKVEVVLTDRYGNAAIYTAVLTVRRGTVPPSIIGAGDIQLVLDSSALFRRGVSAYDAFGRPIDFTVDASAVDVDTLGVYPLIYRAKDCCGNVTEVTVQVYVVDVDPADVHARADAVLERILRDGMTQVEAARAIFVWVTDNVGYAAGFEHRTVYESANQALVHRRGDCFVFYSVSELLLTRAGIPNMRIDRLNDPERPGEQSRHVWNLINPDGLGWHHFDTTPLVVRQLDRFMFTQTQAEEFTRIIHWEGQGSNYFVFDPDLYPEIAR